MVPYPFLLGLVLALHLAIVAFVVGGLVAVILGNVFGWRWANALWFRLAHLGAIGIVVAQSWLGMVCPLTSLELWLRAQSGQGGYAGGFIEHWMERVLYYDAPTWVFTIIYSLFGLAVLAAWWFFPPRRVTR